MRRRLVEHDRGYAHRDQGGDSYKIQTATDIHDCPQRDLPTAGTPVINESAVARKPSHTIRFLATIGDELETKLTNATN